MGCTAATLRWWFRRMAAYTGAHVRNYLSARALSRPMQYFRHLAMIVAVCGAIAGWSTEIAVAHDASRRTIVVRVPFHQVGRASSVITDGRYTFINNEATLGSNPMGPYSGGHLIDEQTNTSTPLSLPGCYGMLASAPWVLFYCPAIPTYELYSITEHNVVSNMSALSGMNPVALGRYWIENFIVGTGSYAFQSTTTQRLTTLTGWKPGGTTIPDLNSPTLAEKLCSPLTVPSDWTPYARWSAYPHNEKLHPGTVTFLGRLRLLQGTSRPNDAGALRPIDYVERCGSQRRTAISGGEAPLNLSHDNFVGNARAIFGGGDYASQMSGYALPSVTPIRIPAPQTDQGLVTPYNITLSSRKVYLVDAAQKLWVAPAPYIGARR